MKVFLYLSAIVNWLDWLNSWRGEQQLTYVGMKRNISIGTDVITKNENQSPTIQ